MTDTEPKSESQAEKFRAKAKELETDDDEKRFDKLVKKLADQKPEKQD